MFPSLTLHKILKNDPMSPHLQNSTLILNIKLQASLMGVETGAQ